MSFFDTIVLGIVEGFTEFLPISSTAHLLMTSAFLRIPESAFLSSFIIAIQVGAIASIVLLYWRTIVFDFETMKRVVAAFIPTALIGYLLYSLIKNVLFENLALISWALILGGLILILFERLYTVPSEQTSLSHMSYRTAVLVGLAQAIAVVPGVSRAGATIIGGMALGVSREKIVEFSFLLAIPTMLAATGYDLLKSGSGFASSEWHLLLVGFIASFIFAYIGVRFLVRFVQTHSFAAFGYYRIIVGILVLASIHFL